MTEDEFEHLDELEAERWISRRFREFADSGLPPDLSLIFAVHPHVDIPDKARQSSAGSPGIGTAA